MGAEVAAVVPGALEAVHRAIHMSLPPPVLEVQSWEQPQAGCIVQQSRDREAIALLVARTAAGVWAV
jgi:hypothetical protein